MSDVIEQVYEEAPSVSAPSTALTVVQRAAVALGADKHEQELVALSKQYTDIVEIKNNAGRDQCHAAAMILSKAITHTDKTGKEAREDANAFQKAVIVEVKRRIAIIESERDRLLALRDKWDAARAAEKLELARIEAERQTKIQSLIDDIKFAPVRAAGKTLDEIAALKDAISETVIDADTYGQRAGDAMMARSQAVAALVEMFNVAVAAERVAEAAALQAATDRIERERVAEENRVESARLAARQRELDVQEAAATARRLQEANEQAERTAEAERVATVERQRVTGIRNRILLIQQEPGFAVGKSSVDIKSRLARITGAVPTETDFAEFAAEARIAHSATVEKLQAALDATLAQEVQAARLLADQAEIARQQAELQRQQEAADNVARINRETQERIEREQKLDADHAEALTENARIDAEHAAYVAATCPVLIRRTAPPTRYAIHSAGIDFIVTGDYSRAEAQTLEYPGSAEGFNSSEIYLAGSDVDLFEVLAVNVIADIDREVLDQIHAQAERDRDGAAEMRAEERHDETLFIEE